MIMISSNLFSISLIFALLPVFLTMSLVSVVFILLTFSTNALYSVFLTTSFFTTLLSLHYYGVLIPKLLNNPLASCSLINFDFLLSHTAHFDKSIFFVLIGIHSIQG